MENLNTKAEKASKGLFSRLATAIGRALKQGNSRQISEPPCTVAIHRDPRAKWQRVAQRRRALESEAGPGFTDEDFEDLCEQYGGRCLCCGGRLALTADHVTPLSEEGKHSIDNIQPLCRECNSRKHTLIVDFRKKENRFRSFVGKTGSKRHILRVGEARTLCGLYAYKPVGFSEITGDSPLCRKCKWSLRSELERLQTKQMNEQST